MLSNFGYSGQTWKLPSNCSNLRFSLFMLALLKLLSEFTEESGKNVLVIYLLSFSYHSLLLEDRSSFFHFVWFWSSYSHKQIYPSSLHQSLTLYHTVPTFNDLEKEAFWKHSGEKEKMLVSSIFSFSHNVFNPLRDKNHHFKYFDFVVCKCFQFGPV